MTCKKEDAAETSESFSLASDNSAFSERSKDVFGGLLKLESNHVQHEKRRRDDPDEVCMKKDPTTLETECLDKSNFKKPRISDERNSHVERSRERRQRDSRGPHGRTSHQQDYTHTRPRRPQGGYGRGYRRPFIPDHKKNPDKWTKYSLEDVSEEDMSEASTRRAALSFLDELRKRREEREGGGEVSVPVDVEGSACSRGNIVFKRPVKKENDKKEGSSVSENKVCSLRSEDDEMEGSVEVTDDSNKKPVFKSAKTNKGQRHIRQRKTRDDDDDE